MSYQTDYDAWTVHVLPLQELGHIATGNSSYTSMLAKAVAETGKSVHELTVGEALKICEETGARYNQIYS